MSTAFSLILVSFEGIRDSRRVCSLLAEQLRRSGCALLGWLTRLKVSNWPISYNPIGRIVEFIWRPPNISCKKFSAPRGRRNHFQGKHNEFVNNFTALCCKLSPPSPALNSQDVFYTIFIRWHFSRWSPSARSNCYPSWCIVVPKGCYPMAFILG